MVAERQHTLAARVVSSTQALLALSLGAAGGRRRSKKQQKSAAACGLATVVTRSVSYGSSG